MADNELTLRAGVSDPEKAVAELRGQLAQNNQAIAQSNRLTIWQLISFTLVMAGTLFGTLAWISTSLREENRLLQRQIEQTRSQLKGQIEQTERHLNDRFAQMEKRFDDLRQVVLSQRRSVSPSQQ